MDTEPTSLYMKDNKGAIRVWSIGVDDGTIVIEHGQLGGSLQTQTEEVPHGKAGRSLEEQIMSRMASRIHRQRDKGYSHDIKDAQLRPVNLLGLRKPMLAQKIERVKNINFRNAFIQPKLDGNRMLIANDNGEIIAYTRNGKRINTLDHILDFVSIPEGSIIDGEIYCHGETLQTIVSWVKRKQENTSRLRYHAYDMINTDSFFDRFMKMVSFDLGSGVDTVDTLPISSMEEATQYFRMYRSDGYEGAIIRTDGISYEDGKRSKSLLKMKEWFDDEFLVIGVEESADGWGILQCALKNANKDIFTVSAPGTMEDKKHVLRNKQFYIGKMITVEYSQITKDGVPFHPVATNWRISI